MHLRSALDRWASRQDATTLDVLGTVRAWVGACILVLAIVAVGSWIPATARHIQLEARVALLAFSLPAVGGFGLALTHRRGTPYSLGEKLSTLWTSTTLQFFCGVLIARSSMLGSVLFFPLLLLTASVHGANHRSTRSEPFPTVGTVCATVAGILLCRTPEQAILLGLCGLLAAVTSLWLGTLAVEADESRQRRERMQAAIAAQGLHDQIAKVRVLSDSLVDVMGSAHDMANALSLVHLSTDLLSTLEDALPPHRRNDLARAEHFLRTSTERIERMLADIRARHKAAEGLPSAKIESVEVAPLVRAVAGTVAQRFPGVTIETGIEDDVRVEVAGGGETLLRVFENLVLNALQGDGNRAADHVYVGCARDARAGSHRIVVEDDGPGFDVKMVERPITAFSSTKASGTGLGLYTVERLVTASGGKIVLENRREGGARVKLDLPRSLG